MANFVLVHGAWHGAWCWQRVVSRLAAQGHRVHAVTLTGVGERVHLMSPLITLETHIADVANLIEAEELQDVVLAVHSYAGMIGTAIADRMPQRLKHLVYVDAVVPRPGESWSSTHASAVRERGMVHQWQHPLAGAVNLVASPLKLGATPVRADLPPPLLGQHTDEVLREVLGWDGERIAALRQDGVV